jgi:hypothetical protein
LQKEGRAAVKSKKNFEKFQKKCSHIHKNEKLKKTKVTFLDMVLCLDVVA